MATWLFYLMSALIGGFSASVTKSFASFLVLDLLLMGINIMVYINFKV